jgi:RNA polymerase sigma-70 factor (ECF subfamily)
LEADEVLIERVRCREVEALGVLYERHGHRAFAVAYKVLSNREAAEEVIQDAFVLMWRHVGTYNSAIGRVRPWLMSIVQYRAIELLRRTKNRPQNVPLDEAWMSASSSDVFSEAYLGVQRDVIAAGLAQLPDEQRVVIERRYYYGNTCAEIAQMMGVPTGTVKSRVRLGLRKLRRLLRNAA